MSVSVRRAASVLERLALVHIAVILLLLAVLLASSCLGAQYLHRYRKYQLAAREDLESLAVSGTYQAMYEIQQYIHLLVTLRTVYGKHGLVKLMIRHHSCRYIYLQVRCSFR